MAVIEPMKERHLRGVVAIEELTSTRPWSLRLFESELRQNASRCFVAVDPHSVVAGFACLLTTGFETHVTNLAVDPSRRRCGLGRELMCRLVDETIALGLDSMTLEVKLTNRPAQELYRRFGFAPGGIRPRYYAETGEDALIMWANELVSADYQQRLAGLRTDRG